MCMHMCVAYSANIDYVNFNEHKIKMVASFTITKKKNHLK